MTDDAPDSSLPNDPFTLEGIIAQEPEKPVWYRRAWVIATAAVAAVVVASVLVDLPSTTTRATDTADQTAIMNEINTDISPCAYGIKETYTIYQDLQQHTLTSGEMAQSPSMMRDDQDACSFTSSSIFDLSNVEGTGTPAGKDVGQVINVATLWTTSDALGAIEDLQTLFSRPGDATALADLSRREGALAKDRAQADGDVEAANRLLAAHIPLPDMPDLPRLRGTR